MLDLLGHEIVEDRDALVHRVLLLPRARLHLLEARAHDDLDVLAAEAAGGAAAVHGGIAAAEHDHALGNLLHVPEGDVGEPVDAEMNVRGGFRAAGHVEIATARRAGADEDRVIALVDHALEAVDARSMAEVHAEVEHVAHLLVDHRFRQAEFRDLRAHEAAGFRFGIENGDIVAERRQIARDGEGGRSRADAGDALAVFLLRLEGHALAHVFLEVGGDALEAADGDRLVLDATAPAGGFARAIARAPENARKDVGLPIDHVGVAVAAGCDQSDVFRDGRVGRAGPLAIDDLVEIVSRRDLI